MHQTLPRGLSNEWNGLQEKKERLGLEEEETASTAQGHIIAKTEVTLWKLERPPWFGMWSIPVMGSDRAAFEISTSATSRQSTGLGCEHEHQVRSRSAVLVFPGWVLPGSGTETLLPHTQPSRHFWILQTQEIFLTSNPGILFTRVFALQRLLA